MEVSNGDVISGYVRWNPAWFTNKNEKSIFPDSLFKSESCKKIGDPLVLYKKVYPIDKPFKETKYFEKNFQFLVTSDEDVIKIPVKELKDIQSEPKKHDGYSGAGEVPVFPKDQVKLMAYATPNAVIVDDSENSPMLFISYNQNIGEQQLQEHLKEYKYGEFKSIETFLEKLRRSKIVLLEIAID